MHITPLHNRTLHISGAFKVPKKVNIEDQKANIDAEKVNIEDMFTPKTAAHVQKSTEALFTILNQLSKGG